MVVFNAVGSYRHWPAEVVDLGVAVSCVELVIMFELAEKERLRVRRLSYMISRWETHLHACGSLGRGVNLTCVWALLFSTWFA